jgi:IS1 family transposase
VGVGLRGLLQFMGEQFQAAPEHLPIKPPASSPAVIMQRLEAELDEIWSFVGQKENRQWVWIALAATTRQVIAFHVGDRSGQSAQTLWEKIPTEYQEQAMFYTDQYAVYTGILPSFRGRVLRVQRQGRNRTGMARPGRIGILGYCHTFQRVGGTHVLPTGSVAMDCGGHYLHAPLE